MTDPRLVPPPKPSISGFTAACLVLVVSMVGGAILVGAIQFIERIFTR